MEMKYVVPDMAQSFGTLGICRRKASLSLKEIKITAGS